MIRGLKEGVGKYGMVLPDDGGSQLAPRAHIRLREQGLEVETPVLTPIGCVTLGQLVTFSAMQLL